MPTHQVHVLFPPPDHPLEDSAHYTIEIVGAALTKLQTMQSMKNTAATAIALHEGDLLGYRFLLPNHTRTVREFFKIAGVRWKGGMSRVSHEYTVEEGAFLVALTGVVVGMDKVPEGRENAPNSIHVLDEVKIRSIPVPMD